MVKQSGTEAAVVFTALEECRKAQPEGRTKWKVWGVTKGGVTRYLWAAGRDHAMRLIAMVDGYVGRCVDAKPANPVAVAGMLATLSEEDRATILAQFSKKGK